MTDAAVKPDPAPHFGNISPDFFTQIGDLIDERDAGGEKRVRRILGHLGAAIVHDQDRVLSAHEGRIEFFEQRDGGLAIAADHDPVGFHEILDRCALFEELRVGDHIKRMGRVRRHRLTHLICCPHRHRALEHDHAVAWHNPSHIGCRLQHHADIG